MSLQSSKYLCWSLKIFHSKLQIEEMLWEVKIFMVKRVQGWKNNKNKLSIYINLINCTHFPSRLLTYRSPVL